MVGIKDRHTLIELGGDFTDEEIGHLLRHAYLNHKAPHEYYELRKYIRDIVIGNHNSVYIMSNGIPQPFASASILGAPYLSTLNDSFAYHGSGSNTALYYDYLSTSTNNVCPSAMVIGEVSNGTCSSANPYPIGWGIGTYGYNNGNAIVWQLYYTTNSFISQGTSTSGAMSVGPYPLFYFQGVVPKYGYAPYVSSSSPLTLTTYYYWNYGSSPSSLSFNYVYFGFLDIAGASSNALCNVGNGMVNTEYYRGFIPLFYSQGNYSFNANTYYITMWQWTYT